MKTGKTVFLAILAAAFACALVDTAAAQSQVVGLTAGELPGSGGTAERLALLTVDEQSGAQTMLARLVARVDGNGRQAGDRIGDDAAIDGAAIWGTSGTGIDVDISSYLKPGRLFVLLDNLQLVEIRGIWGTGGTAVPDPEDIVIHEPLWDVAACGRPTAMAEGLRRVAQPGATSDQPILAIGTEGGCVGLASVPQIENFYSSPADWQELPIVATGDPLIAIWGTSGTGFPVRDVVIHPTREEWGVLNIPFTPGSDNWVAPTAGWTAPNDNWSTDPNDWIPSGVWYGIGAVSGDRVIGIFPGALGSSSAPGAPPYTTYRLEAFSLNPPLTSLQAERPAVGAAPVISIPDSLPKAVLAGANGTQSVLVASIGPGMQWNTASDFVVDSETDLAIPSFDRIALGSLWAAGADGRSLAYLPEYDAASGAPGPVIQLEDLFDAEINPRAINRKSRGNFVTATISGDGVSVLSIQPLSARLAVEGVDADWLWPVQHSIESADDDGENDVLLVLKFDRQTLQDRLADLDRGDNVNLRLTWSYSEGCSGDPCTAEYMQPVRIVK